MFLRSVPLHCPQEGRKARCRGGMGMWEDGCVLKAGPAVGHAAITSGAVGLSLTTPGAILYNIKHNWGALGFLKFSS